MKFDLGFAVIQEATQEEIRTLFARLQTSKLMESHVEKLCYLFDCRLLSEPCM